MVTPNQQGERMGREREQRPAEPAKPAADGVVVNQQPAATPAKPAKPKQAPDVEFSAMARITRILNTLEPDARERVVAFLAARFKPKAVQS